MCAAAGGVSWPAELQRARIYLTTLHVSEPLDALDRIVTAHSGPTLLVLAAEPHTTLDVVTKVGKRLAASASPARLPSAQSPTTRSRLYARPLSARLDARPSRRCMG